MTPETVLGSPQERKWSGPAEWFAVVSLLVLAFGGYVKGSRHVQELPFDITILAAAAVAVQVAFQLQRRGTKPPRFVWVLLLMLITFLVGLVPGGIDANSYAANKPVQVFGLVPLCVLGGCYLLGSEARRAKWIAACAAYGMLVIALAFVDPSSASDRFSIEGSNAIAAGRAAGASLVVFALCALQLPRWRISAALAVLVTGYATLSAASRGPLLAAAVAVVLAAGIAPRRGRLSRLLLLGLGVVSVLLLALPRLVLSDRLTTVEDRSSEARRILWDRSLTLAGDNVWGIGWGRLYERIGVTPLDSGYVQYAHNLFLEVAVESGVLASALVLVLVVLALREQRAMARNVVETALLGLFAFHLVNAMVSGDIGANRGVWVAIGAALVPLAARLPREKDEDARPPRATPGRIPAERYVGPAKTLRTSRRSTA